MNNKAPKVLEQAPVITVRVTARHIHDAVRGDGAHCMIADAIVDAYPNASYVLADLQAIRVTDLTKGRRYFYFTPLKAALALLDFDDGKVPKPFAFQLRDAVVRYSGWRASHGPGWTPKDNRASKPKADRDQCPPNSQTRFVPPARRRFGLRLFSAPRAAKAKV